MGTEIGIKGAGPDPRVFGRVEALVELRERLRVNFEIFVDGGIRREVVGTIPVSPSGSSTRVCSSL